MRKCRFAGNASCGRKVQANVSRAFLRESTLEEPEVRPTGRSPLPQGSRNLITAAGLRELTHRLNALARQRAERAGDRSEEGRRELMLIDEELRPIERSVRTAEVVPPPPPGAQRRVRFGATVTVRDQEGEESRYRIVGADEADPSIGDVSYLSPIAQALLNAQLHQRVPFRFPSGQALLEIVAIRYG